MRLEGPDRCRDDDGQRGADGERHADGFIRADDAEQFVQYWYNNDAAANAEYACEKACRAACNEKADGEKQEFPGGDRTKHEGTFIWVPEGMRGMKRSRGGHGAAVDEGDGFTQHGQTGGAFDAFGGEVTAEGARSGSAREQAEQMAGHGV